MKNLLAVLCTAFLAAGCVNTSKANKPPAPLVALQVAPEFTLENVRGGKFSSSELKGKVVVVDFWATWCPPCKVEIPEYNKLRAQLKDRGVEFLGVTYQSGSIEDVKPWLKELEIQYPVVMGDDAIDAGLGGHFGYPTTFLIGKDWKVYRKIIGGDSMQKLKDLERDIHALLEKPGD
jgi:cytochrome c biogenesis protein CcmG/thiol:disulfide interchange protein DsbE